MFQPRTFKGFAGASETHIEGLMFAIRHAPDHLIDPIDIWWSGKRWLVIDGHHRLLHRVPLFWRLHRAHHTDVELDVTTGVRFHPLEALFSLGIKFVAVMLLGAPGAATVTFEILLSITAIFSHANTAVPHGSSAYSAG